MKTIALKFIVIVRKIRHLYAFPECRFYPSCSHYAEEAILRRGLLIGMRLAIWRLLRCNQLFKGGFDPVPHS